MFCVFKLPDMLTSIAINNQINLSKILLTFYGCVFGVIFTDLKFIFFVTSSTVSDTVLLSDNNSTTKKLLQTI